MLRRVAYRTAVVGVLLAVFGLWAFPRVSAQAGARERTVFVTVTDRAGEPVDTLVPGDITIREDGVSREILRVSRATEPLDIAILVDNAASSGELIPRVREGLKAFVASMAPQHAVALIGLADRPTIFVDYTNDQKKLLDGINRLFTQSRSGMTLLDGVVEVASGLSRREAARTAIVPIVTDGTEFTNRHYRDVLEALAKSGAALYPITVGRFTISEDDVTRDRALLLDAGPTASGGRRFSLLSSNAVEATLTRLAHQLNAQFKVVYSRPETLIPPEKVEVSASKAGLSATGTPLRTTRTGA